MAALLATGLAGLVLSIPRVACLLIGLSGALAYYLQQSVVPTGETPRGAPAAARTFDVEQYSTANIFSGGPDDLDLLTHSDADIIAIQGLTPDWSQALAAVLQPDFAHQYLFPDIGVHGIGLFAREALGAVDSVLVNGVVQVRACVTPGRSGEELQLLAVQTVPPVSNDSYLSLQAQLEALSAMIRRVAAPVVLMGDFNAVPWSPELNRFSQRAGVRDSRRCLLPSYEQGSPAMFEAPVEHIFYNEGLECLRFETLRTDERYLGNRASFQTARRGPTVVAL